MPTLRLYALYRGSSKVNWGFYSFPGANYNSHEELETFFNTAMKQTSCEDYAGQVNVVILGSNDHRIISCLRPSSVSCALSQFKFKLDQFLEKMLTVKQSTIILITSVLPKQFINTSVQSIARQVVR